MTRYNPAIIEPKWQKKWADTKIYAAEDFSDKPKFVVLTEFPYPSGAGLHMGHLREYTLGDVIARYKRARGYNVLFPMGFDAFGLPAENYAIKNKVSPENAVEVNVKNFRHQLDMMGYSIDHDRSFNTTDPEYYKWTQWFFLQFFKKGLAYQDEISINWCPFCKTGLANEEVVNGRHERCDNLVEKKMLKQWMLRITDYAERLIGGLRDVDYPSRIAEQQVNWIGKSVGAEIDFAIEGSEGMVKVFTTRPDTIFGATFMVLAPEHPLVVKITTPEKEAEVETYIKAAQAKSDIERQDTNREKTGVFTGAYAVNPATNEKIPIWVADYVLMGYGTGAIMAVPAHDERDYEFAKKFGIEIREVVAQDFGETRDNEQEKDGITAVIYDEKTDEFAVTNWTEKKNYQTIIAGGREDNEDYETTLRREVREEAGISKIAKIVQLGEPVFAHYYHDIKKINRRGKTQGFLAIVDRKQGESAAHEVHEKFDIKWISRKEFTNLDFAGENHDTGHWDLIRDRALKYLENREIQPELFAGEGVVINSGKFDGLTTAEMKEKVVKWLEEKGAARAKINYKLHDWVYSRQRYWGEPIPIIHCPKCGAVPVPEEDLPVKLPTVDHYEPTDDGQSPLSRVEAWVNTTCPKCGGAAKRETDTMPNWAGSNWYYLRYFDAHNDKRFADPEKLKYWGMVDLYLGGMEHTTLHLLYSRFHHQFLYDQGLVPTPEPYAARRGQGIILAADGRKMSKSLGNVVDPTPIIESGYGADAARLAVTFLAPFDQTTPWSPEAVAGCYRFLGRVWNLVQAVSSKTSSESIQKILHRTIKKVSDDLENMSYNTAIAALMEALNGFSRNTAEVGSDAMTIFLQLLAPFAPHITAELYEQMGNSDPIESAGWPKYDKKYLVDEEMSIAVQVNGKLRGEVTVAVDATEDEIKTTAMENENVKNFLGEKEIRKTIYVPGKIINFVILE